MGPFSRRGDGGWRTDFSAWGQRGCTPGKRQFLKASQVRRTHARVSKPDGVRKGGKHGCTSGDFMGAWIEA